MFDEKSVRPDIHKVEAGYMRFHKARGWEPSHFTRRVNDVNLHCAL
jgi:hypothetical protein